MATELADNTKTARLWSRPRLPVGQWGLYTGAVIIAFIFLVAIFAPWLAPHSPYEQSLVDRLIPPVFMENGTWDHILGTDHLGRDYLSRRVPRHPVKVAPEPVKQVLVGHTLVCSPEGRISERVSPKIEKRPLWGRHEDVDAEMVMNVHSDFPVLEAGPPDDVDGKLAVRKGRRGALSWWKTDVFKGRFPCRQAMHGRSGEEEKDSVRTMLRH